MSILNNEKETVKDFVDNNKKKISQFYKITTIQFNAIVNSIYKNPKFTAEEIFSEYGSDGVELAKMSSAFAEMVTKISGETPKIVPDGYTLNVGEDGVITLVKQ